MAPLNNGIRCPDFLTGCELGFGQGISANIHAASSSQKWFGTDFNPSQTNFACELATVSEANIELFDDSFLEFSERENLPEFDFI